MSVKPAVKHELHACQQQVSLLLDSQAQPLIVIGYNELDLPASSVGVPRIIAGDRKSVV